MKLSDEQLMAYADGDPSAADATIAEKARAGFSAEERQVLEDYRRTRDVVREAFAEDDREPLPAGLVAMVLGGKEARDKADAADAVPQSNATEKPAENVVALRRPARPQRSWMRVAVALAASIAVAFVVLPVWLLGDRSADTTKLVTGPVSAGSALANILERQPSAVPVALDAPSGGSRQHLMVAATFRDRSARICREVELLDAALAPRMVAVACRGAVGIWLVEGTAVIAQKDQGGSTTFTPAGAPEEDALAALRSMLGAKTTMSPADEKMLLDNGWK